MKKLRRRAIAKAVGMRYKTRKCGGYELTDKYGSFGSFGSSPTDGEFICLIKRMDDLHRVRNGKIWRE